MRSGPATAALAAVPSRPPPSRRRRSASRFWARSALVTEAARPARLPWRPSPRAPLPPPVAPVQERLKKPSLRPAVAQPARGKSPGLDPAASGHGGGCGERTCGAPRGAAAAVPRYSGPDSRPRFQVAVATLLTRPPGALRAV